MKKFKELNKNICEEELRILKTWEEENILEKTITNRRSASNFVFYDGPATANGMPGIHHLVSKLLKDVTCKYKTMQGFKVIRKIGWDTHGLPVEVQVEKELGFKNKSDIETYGIKAFNEKCRESVWKNEEAFRSFTKRIGQFIDLEHPYITYENDYIETEWWLLKHFFEKGLIYDGLKIIPYCPRCGTGLASHEVAQGYQEVAVNSVYVPFKVKDKDEYFLVWTTTPWTLMANVALCVNPNEEYITCLVDDKKFILAKRLSSLVLDKEFKVLETRLGKELEGIEYEQLMPFLTVEKQAFFVTLGDYVTMEDGTGIVHIAPAFGQDDYEVGLKYNLPTLNPVDEEGKYNVGPWLGRFVVDSELEIDIIKYLASEGKLYKKLKITHNYPHCWRCKTPLIYYSKPSLYIKTTSLKDKIIEANKKVNWIPSYIGEKRFANWLENMNDWAISRSRYWGCPIPLYKCSCSHQEMIGSIQELREKSITELPEKFDLHRPFVDDIKLKCPECSKKMTRIPEVLDCWFDSGAMPFAQYHYPFENKELWQSQFPADFIAEGIDQTRGWFYSLLVIATCIEGQSPYKNVLVNDLLLDKYGQKMHKSKGNAVDPFTILDKYGADLTRWYLLYLSPVWTPIKFDEEGLKEVHSKFFNPLRNVYNFFSLYANTDEINIDECNVPYENREEMDKWILSKYNSILKEAIKSYEAYDYNKVVKTITDFVSLDFSNWYIRRGRDRFWGATLNNSKKSVYLTTYEILVSLMKIIAPIIPFLAEEIYQNLTGEVSVHLSDFPQVDEKLIDLNLEKKMNLVRDLISIGRMSREEAKIKVRQPLSEVLLDFKNKEIINGLESLIIDELNVQNIKFIENMDEYMNFFIKPNYKNAGRIFGSKIKEYEKMLLPLPIDKVLKLKNEEEIDLMIGGQEYLIDANLVEIKITPKEGFNMGVNNDNFVILNTNLTENLVSLGIAREFVSKIQNMRKENAYEVQDRIDIYYQTDEKTSKYLKENEDYIKKETLAEILEEANIQNEKIDINGFKVAFKIEKK